MSWWQRFQRSKELDRALDAELRDHLERLTADYVRAGMADHEAHRKARLEFGGLDQTKDACRDMRPFFIINGLGQDVRLAFRSLRATPVVTAVAILSLSFGIGANTAIFSLVNSLFLRTLPVSEPERLVTVSTANPGALGDREKWTFATWEQIQQRSHVVDGALAWSAPPFNLAQGGEVQPVDGLFASGDFFATLGVPALIGRTFTATDDVRTGGPDGLVAVLSYSFWQGHFGGAANALESTLVLNGVPFTIVGVTPPGFFGTEVGRAFDVAVPIATEPLIRRERSSLESRTSSWLSVMLRLKRGQSLEAATAAMRGVQPQIREAAMPAEWAARLPARFLNEPFTLVPAFAGASDLRVQYQRPLLTMLIVVSLVLLIACANIANLLLARATARRHELSVRLALGAPRWRLARQLLIESLALSAAGAIGGLTFAAWGSRALVAQLSTSVDRVFLDLPLDWRVLAFTAVVTVATTVLFGTAPAFRATRVPPIDALKEQGRGGSTRERMTVANGLVVSQVALSVVLVVAAGLFVRTFERLAKLPLGFDADRILVVSVNSESAHVSPANRVPLYNRLVEAVAAVPGVAHVGGSLLTPVSGGIWGDPVDVSGAPNSGAERPSSAINAVTPGWFAAYGIPILRGRDIHDSDTKTLPPVVVINDAFARKFLPGQESDR
jgi:putative ABC transport system permease protein